MRNLQETRTVLEEADLIWSAEDIAAAITRVAEEITAVMSEENPLLLCVMNGGVPFASDLMMQLKFPLDFDYMHVSRYGSDLEGGTLSWRSVPWTSIKDRTVLVVDDILDEGVTLAGVAARLMQLGARKCYIAVATEKLNGVAKPIKADFVALTLPNRFVFGYGMDVSGAWRNLPAIYAVKGK